MAKGGQVEVLHPRWPAGRTIEQQCAQQAFWTAQGQCTLNMLAHMLTNKVSDQCEILLKPSRGVRTTKEIQAGELALLPEGKVLFYPEDKKAAALSAGAVRVDFDPASSHGRSRPDATDGLVAVAPRAGMDSASPWWFVSTTKEPSEANVELIMYKVTSVAACDPVSSLVPKGRIAQSAARGLVADDAFTTSVSLPLLVNPGALAAGTLLKRYAPKKQEDPKDPKAITPAQVAKRAKLSG